MSPATFPEANTQYRRPAGYEESQIATIPAYRGNIDVGSLDGDPIVVVAWKPDAAELAALNEGGLVYLTMLGGLAPHMLSTNFATATNPA